MRSEIGLGGVEMKDYTWKLDNSDAWENDTLGSEEDKQ